jgi:MarR family transcriptional regulator, organic hydroperoxide resistance regulator
MVRSGELKTSEHAYRSLLRAFGALKQAMEPHFAEFGISGPQWAVLVNLHRAAKEGSSVLRLGELGERLFIKPPSVTGVVDRLERAGLVARSRQADDLRVRTVSLTAKGRSVVDKVLAVQPERVREAMNGLSAAELEVLGRLLERLDTHLRSKISRAERAGASANTLV